MAIRPDEDTAQRGSGHPCAPYGLDGSPWKQPPTPSTRKASTVRLRSPL